MSHDSASQLTKSLEDLNVSEDFTYPEEWRLNPDEPDALIHRLPADLQKYEQKHKEAGVPYHHVVTDEHGTLKVQPRAICHPDAASDSNLKHEMGIEYVTLSRPVPEDQRGNASGDRMVLHGADDTATEFIVVPENEVAGREADGWKVWYPEPPAFEFKEGVYKDHREYPIEHVNDVTTDEPAADTDQYLAIGNDFVSRHWTNGNWKPGDLIGPNGSDAETKAKSPSYTAPENWNKLEEHRSATSTGHIFQYDRPDNVCLGWGGYDKYTEWQSNGRAITKEMVEKTVDWSTDLSKPFDFVDEDGKHIETVTATVKDDHIPSRPVMPKSLYDAVNEDKAKKDKAEGHKQHNLGGKDQTSWSGME